MEWILIRDMEFLTHKMKKGTILKEHVYQNFSYYEKKEIKDVEKSRFFRYKFVLLFDHTKNNKKRYFAIGKDVKRYKRPRIKRSFEIE